MDNNNQNPNNWFLAGSQPTDYEIGVDRIVKVTDSSKRFNPSSPRPLNLDFKS